MTAGYVAHCENEFTQAIPAFIPLILRTFVCFFREIHDLLWSSSVFRKTVLVSRFSLRGMPTISCLLYLLLHCTRRSSVREKFTFVRAYNADHDNQKSVLTFLFVDKRYRICPKYVICFIVRSLWTSDCGWWPHILISERRCFVASTNLSCTSRFPRPS